MVKGTNITVGMTQRDQPDTPEYFSFPEINLCTTVLTGQMINKPQNVTVVYKTENKTLYLPDISGAVALDKLVIVGDTGCRDNEDQSCETNDTWPYASVLESIKENLGEQSPTAFLHVGDHRYNNPYLDGKKFKEPFGKPDYWESTDSDRKDGGWKFEAIEPLSVISSHGPWIFLRGNHEQCYSDKDYEIPKETGEAFLYLFGYRDDELAAGEVRCTDEDFLDPYAIDFKYKVGEMRLITMDLIHKTLDGAEEDYVAEQLEEFTNQYNSIEGMITDQNPSVTILTHHIPIISLKRHSDQGKDGNPKDLQFNANHITTDALKRSNLVEGDESFEHIPLILSGHAHNFQLTTPDNKGDLPNTPYQYVIGDSGVNLSGGDVSGKLDVEWKPFKKKGEQKKSSIEEKWHTYREKSFGYVIATFSSTDETDTLTFTPYFGSKASYNADDKGQCTLTYSDKASSGKVDCPKLK